MVLEMTIMILQSLNLHHIAYQMYSSSTALPSKLQNTVILTSLVHSTGSFEATIMKTSVSGEILQQK